MGSSDHQECYFDVASGLCIFDTVHVYHDPTAPFPGPWKVTIFARGPQAFQAFQRLGCIKLRPQETQNVEMGENGKCMDRLWDIVATPFLTSTKLSPQV